MLRINRKTDYAIRVVLALAKRPPGARLSTDEIQAEMLVPRPFLQRIVAELARLVLIETIPGPNGGLELARASEEISLRDVIEGLNGPLMLSDCLCEPGYCPLGERCPVRGQVGKIQRMLLRELEGTTFAQLAQDAHVLVEGDPQPEAQFAVI
jgi:Rrf2 family protein